MQDHPEGASDWAGLPKGLLGTAFDDVLNWDCKNIRLVRERCGCYLWWSTARAINLLCYFADMPLLEICPRRFPQETCAPGEP